SAVYGFQNNLAPTSGSVLTTRYGVQKNVSNTGGVVSTGVSTIAFCGVFSYDFKYLLLEKENVPVKRDAEVLVLAKDSGKQFTSTTALIGGGQSASCCPLVEKQFIFSQHNGFVNGSSGVVMKDKATYAGI
uniref:Uncharacterized protein n=1 Tax=Myripristis murdjan TaxID=586833 RepID=A0A667YNI5_9TELE